MTYGSRNQSAAYVVGWVGPAANGRSVAHSASAGAPPPPSQFPLSPQPPRHLRPPARLAMAAAAGLRLCAAAQPGAGAPLPACTPASSFFCNVIDALYDRWPSSVRASGDVATVWAGRRAAPPQAYTPRAAAHVFDNKHKKLTCGGHCRRRELAPHGLAVPVVDISAHCPSTVTARSHEQ